MIMGETKIMITITLGHDHLGGYPKINDLAGPPGRAIPVCTDPRPGATPVP
ncbi:hypothetical protein SCAB_61052 [Streptomyces scabiei 87.22]|uniref:Uncharacterized protein n=1 Tax=Streptomyces scabiei (strain 87.22) TaxID=680198 RepID=C9Z937_STRSW|nr:hypothetical protein SCAB_61052 [Streptomyces scabiei 87.22]